jgi:hypothetical protein
LPRWWEPSGPVLRGGQGYQTDPPGPGARRRRAGEA